MTHRRPRGARGVLLALALSLVATGFVPLSATPARAADPSWRGEYFANTTLEGAPAVSRDDAAIDFDWGAGSPDSAVPVDEFSVRWTRTLTLAAGTYRFTTTTDDGVRLFVDGELKIDRWVDQSPTEWQADVALAAGDHTVVMEYYENGGGAMARLVYGTVQGETGPGAWRGEYFDNPNLANQPIMTRADPAIDFDWGAGSPGFGLPSDNFSVRWTRTLTLAAGTYHFTTTTDDGVRLLVDGQAQIDDWTEHTATTRQADVTLAAGDHTVVVEYFEKHATAVVKMNWAQRAAGGGVRINVGGGDYADSSNRFWDADTGFTGGTITEETQPVWNTTDDPLFVNERAGAFKYALPLPAGSYVVRFHFAELFFASPGVRRFNVAIEGAQVLSSFDIYAQAGKAALITRSFTTTVTDGTLNLDFSKVFDNAAVQAIDVYPAGGTEDLNNPDFAPIPEPENATHSTPPSVTLKVTDDRMLNDGYWRVDDQSPQPLFTNLAGPSHSAQFTMPLETFNALALGSHTLSFGANDHNGNAWTQKWRFRKLDSGGGSVPIAFNRRVLVSPSTPGASSLKHPTTVQFGPDGKLYVGQQDGYIHVLTLDADRKVVGVQRITAIHDTPNRNPDGSPATVVGRHLTGIDFDPASTPSRPILWAVHSDPRFCFNQSPTTCPVNIDSGILTRLTGPSFDQAANRTDFVTGLPRSRENHAPNAVHFGPDGWLYTTLGSDTNYGAPSTAFSGLAERYLTASVVRFNVKQTAAFPIDVRNVTSAAGLIPGVFELYATGYRNAYDFLWHSNGRLYANVNAGNFTAGNTPGPDDGCPDGYSFDPGTRADFLSLVEQGDYGGNPDPARQECVLDEGTMYPTPKTPEPDYHPPILHYSNGTSSDGMAEYTSPTFGGQMLHNIISATYAGNQSVRRVVLSADGRSVLFEEDLAIFNQPLDVAVGPEGSIYVAEYGANDLQIMAPSPTVEGSWETQTPLPVPTQEHGVVACAGKVYVLGGLTAPSTDTNAVWAYDPGTKQWSAAAPYPGIAVDHPGAACVTGKVYLLGGLVNAGTPVKTVYRYDPTTDAWEPRADMPTARGAMGVAVQDGKIYAAGGIGYPAKADMATYDPAADAWQSLAPMPTPRDHLVMESVGGKLYAIGGRNVTVGSVVATNEVYDPDTNTWAARAPMPVARGGIASATLHEHIQVWGGEGPSGTPTSTYPQGHDYDPKTDTWIPIAGEPTPRHGTDAATLGLSAYVPAGGPQTGSSVSDVNEVFSFVSGTPPTSCIEPGSDPRTTDSDGDSYTDQDEADNNTDPCSPASVPADNDRDHVSDLNDPDDDNDGIADADDQYQYDADNGTATALPWVQNWNPGDPPAGKLGNSGFPGYQLTSHGTGLLPDLVHVGGAGGFLSLKATAGTNQGATNSQDNALQVGFDARQPVTISTRLADPLSGQVVEPGKSGGIFFGLDEDSYAKFVFATDDGSGKPGLVLAVETNGVYRANPSITPVPIDLATLRTLDLSLTLDPATKRITARYRVNSDAQVDLKPLGSVDAAAFPELAGFFKLGAAAGILTSNAAPSPFGLAYDYFRIDPATARLTVNKVLVPSGDTGRFDLRVDDVTKAAGVGDGGTTGPLTLAAGRHTVSEAAAAGTNLADYTRSFSGDCGPDGTVTLTAGDDKTCTITNRRNATDPVLHISDVLTTNASGAPQTTFTAGSTAYWQVKIVDQRDSPVSGVSVTTTLKRPDGSTLATIASTTSSSGLALFNRRVTGAKGVYTITVSNVSKAGTTYDAAANAKSSTTFSLR
jgi:N-acetylneuraminic acid mutarotase/glucose/arabinose dehydrogenase